MFDAVGVVASCAMHALIITIETISLVFFLVQPISLVFSIYHSNSGTNRYMFWM